MNTALITGTSKGIGKAIAEKLLEQGWIVYGISRGEKTIDNDSYNHIKIDLLKSELIEENLSNVPLFNLIIHNAGDAYFMPAAEVTEASFNHIMGINLKAPMLINKYLINAKKVDPQSSQIITISSDASKIPFENFSLYAASKAALDMYSKIFEKETGIKVVSIHPGNVQTPLSERIGALEEEMKKFISTESLASFILDILGGKYNNYKEFIITNNFLAEDLEGFNDPGVKIINVDEL